MNKYIIVAVVFCGIILGAIYGNSIDPNQYPFIIDPTPPFTPGSSLTARGDWVTEDTLPQIMAAPNSKGYLFVRTSVSCDDINIYLLEDTELPADTQPEQVIAGQDVDCKQQGSFIDTELVTSANQSIVLESDTPFTYAAYYTVDDDSLEVVDPGQGDDDNE